MRRFLFPTALAAAALGAGVAHAHARLKVGSALEPRSGASNLKSSPCGGVAAVEANRKTLNAGAAVNVQWEETINHPGYFRLLLLDATGAPKLDGAGAPIVILDRYDDDQNTAASDAAPHQFSTNVTMPDIDCADCIVQFIQVMTDRTPPTNYYSCADVKIEKSGGTGTDTDTGTDTNTSTETATATSTDTGTASGPLPAPSGVIVDVVPDDGAADETELKAKGGQQ
jgi:hypothetical protein